jgi:hypothetical protein
VHTIVDEIGNDNRVDLWQLDRGIVGTFRRPEIVDYQFDAVDAQMLAITNSNVGNRESLWIVGSNNGSPICALVLGVIEETSAYWRVVFDYPPFNIVGATIFEVLQGLLARMDASPSLRVVVFESANPEFYLAHL